MTDENKASASELEERPEAVTEGVYVWQEPDSTEVPEAIRKKYPNSRFYWRGETYADEKGIGRWEPVEVDDKTRRAANLHRYGGGADGLVKRGDCFLVHMPEGLAQARERHLDEVNLRQEVSSEEKLAEKLAGRDATTMSGGVIITSPRSRPPEEPIENAETLKKPEPEKRGPGRPRKAEE